MKIDRRLIYFAQLIFLFGAYFVTARFGLWLGAVSKFAALIWPPTGIALAYLFFVGLHLWPSVFLGAFFVNFTIGAPPLLSFGIAVGNTLEALLGAYLLKRFEFSPKMDRLKDIFLLIFFGVITATPVSATIGVTSLWLGHLIPLESYSVTWRAWWVGDALGNLLIAPFLMTWVTRSWPKLNFFQIIEAIGLLLSLTIIQLFAFDIRYETTIEKAPILWVAFPFMIWAALRFDPIGTTTTVLLVSILTTWKTVRGTGPFAHKNVAEGLYYLQVFQSILSITGMILAAVVAERKKVMRVLQKAYDASEIKFKLIVNSIQDYAIFMLDPKGFILSWNRGAERIEGYHSEEIIGKNFSVFYLPDDIHRHIPERNLEIAKVKGKFEEENWRIRKDGSLFWAGILITRMEIEGDLVGFSKVTRDLSEQKKAKDHLRKAYESLERRIHERTLELAKTNQSLQESENRLKAALSSRDEFIGIASHELKTPLTSLKMQLQLIQRSAKLDKNLSLPLTKLAKSLEISSKQVDRLTTLINDLLDVSRIQTGRLTYHLETVNLSELLRTILDWFADEFNQAKCSLEFRAEKNVIGQWDRSRIEQVALNLISNVLKYAPGSQILVLIEKRAQAAYWIVQDTGPGIPKDRIEKIFDPYERASQSKDIPGLGLGLFISKKIVEGHHGKISVESEPGKGTKFIVHLPLYFPNKS